MINVPLVCVDPANLVFQWLDAPQMAVVTLYEGGKSVFLCEGDVPDIYAGPPPKPGHYRTSNVRNLVQLGSTPVRSLTVDVKQLDNASTFERHTSAGAVCPSCARPFSDSLLTVSSMQVCMREHTDALIAGIDRAVREVAAFRTAVS